MSVSSYKNSSNERGPAKLLAPTQVDACLAMPYPKVIFRTGDCPSGGSVRKPRSHAILGLKRLKFLALSFETSA